MLHVKLELALPSWIDDVIDSGRCYVDEGSQMALAVALSRHNVEAGSGGPFGAAVFGAGGHLLAVGVNRVLPHHCSVAHAETMACMLAQQRLQTPRLNANGGPITLATSSQPCCQCFGAIIWAGIDRLLIGARAEDVEALTDFDEGPLPADWTGELSRRGVAVTCDILRDDAREVLRQYGQQSGGWY